MRTAYWLCADAIVRKCDWFVLSWGECLTTSKVVYNQKLRYDYKRHLYTIFAAVYYLYIK